MAVDIINGISTYIQEAYPGVEASKYQPGYVAPPGYDLIFMNDAMADQPVLQGYGDATYQRLKYIQKEYDPMGVFPQRTNGFKFTWTLAKMIERCAILPAVLESTWAA